MSEVKRYRASLRHVVETEFDDAQFVGAADFDAEHALRLAAERQAEAYKESRERLGLELGKALLKADHFERQAGELRGQLDRADASSQKVHEVLTRIKAERDTAMGFLREWDGMWNGGGIHNGPLTKLRNKTAAFLNTTSTEGKDHE